MTLQALRGHRRILIDSSVWIYHFEQHRQFGPAAGRVIEALEEGRFRGVVSELTLLELTVRPLQLGRQDVADEYELLLSYFPNLELEPVSRDILLSAAALRARHRLRTPDAILLATGIRCAATAAITNDEGWRAAQPAGIEPLLLSELLSG
ncbi:MAG: type II toxin-antitoxin system VapC family toxin [Steroidobacteraceae bacterium]